MQPCANSDRFSCRAESDALATAEIVFGPKSSRAFRFDYALRYQHFEFPVPMRRCRATSADQHDMD